MRRLLEILNQMKKISLIQTLCDNNDVKLTPLREDILNILLVTKYPITAYEILAKLKKVRSNAEPPTVYRVLDFLVENKIVHRIESENKYICCSHSSKGHHHSVLFYCKDCHKTNEYIDDYVSKSIKQFSQRHEIITDDEVVELRGVCQTCITKHASTSR
jgi:Fur family zinc uptake transcriptional regulator